MTIHSRIATTDLHRNAYNAAFYELGLGWHWDARTFDGLLQLDCEKERVRSYMIAHQSHLLNVYDADFMAKAIETTKSRYLDHMSTASTRGAKHASTNWEALHSRQIGA